MSIIPNTNNIPTDTKEIRFNGYGHEMRLGEIVWLRKLGQGIIIQGGRVQQKYGQYKVRLRQPIAVRLRHAKQEYWCRNCRQKICEGDMHGSEFYNHYCLDCVTPFEPETQVEFEW